MATDNPYSQPDADIVTSASMQELPVHGPVHRPFHHGFDWVADAWVLFLRAPFAWVGAALLIWLVTLVANLVLALIPLIGGFAQWVLYPIFTVGLLHIAHSVDRGEGVLIGDVFAGFRHQTGSLAGLGALYILVMIALVVIMAVVLFVVLGGDLMNQVAAAGDQQAVPLQEAGGMSPWSAALLVVLVPGFMFAMIGVMWFGPALVYFGDVHPARAIMQSLAGAFRNIPAFIMYFLVMFGLMILLLLLPVLLVVAGALLAGVTISDGFDRELLALFSGAGPGILGTLGFIGLVMAWIGIMVMAVISIYTAFRDIFISPE